MPIYEYVCNNCELRFELLRSLKESGNGASCPSCSNGAERILSPFMSFSVINGENIPLAGSNPCSSCGATSCDTCNL